MGRKITTLGLLLVLCGVGCFEEEDPRGTTDTGTTSTDPDAGPGEPNPDAGEVGAVGMYLQLGDETPTVLSELTVDAETYTEIVDALGTVPPGLVEGEPSREPGQRQVTPVVSAVADTLIFEGISRAERGESTAELGEMRILFGLATPEPIGLLLPAVQKVREAAARTQSSTGKLVFELGFQFDVVETELVALSYAEAETPRSGDDEAGRSLDMEGDHFGVAPELSAIEQARHDLQLGADFFVEGDLRFVRGADDALLIQPWTASVDALGMRYMESWAELGGERSLVIDVVDPDGRVHHRFRIPRASAPGAIDIDTPMSTSVSGYVKIDGIPGTADDPSAEIERFDTHFVRYEGASFDRAATLLSGLSRRSTPALAASWTDSRTALIASLREASVNANDMEGLLCASMMPMTGGWMETFEAALADGRIEDAPDLRRALADYEEAYEDLGEPELHAFVGGTLPSSAYDRDLEPANAETACGSIVRLLALLEADPSLDVLIDTDERAFGGAGNDILIGGSGRHFDATIVEVIEALDLLAADPGVESVPLEMIILMNHLEEQIELHRDLAVRRYRLTDVIISSYR